MFNGFATLILKLNRRSKNSTERFEFYRFSAVFCYIGNFDFEEEKKERMATEHMLDKRAFEYNKKAVVRSKNTEIFFPKIIVKRVIFAKK